MSGIPESFQVPMNLERSPPVVHPDYNNISSESQSSFSDLHYETYPSSTDYPNVHEPYDMPQYHQSNQYDWNQGMNDEANNLNQQDQMDNSMDYNPYYSHNNDQQYSERYNQNQ